MGDRCVKKVERSKEGVPIWDGDAATYQEYAEMAALWEQSIPYHKRYLAGPKLVNELTGTARRFVLAKEPTWVSFDGGVQVLLDHLRMNLGLPQMSELSDFMAKYFRYSKRKRHESMNDYITRKAELYARARYSLSRVQQRYEPKKSSWMSRPGPGQSDMSQHQGSRAPSEAPPDAPDPAELPRPGWQQVLPHVDEWIREEEEDDAWQHYRQQEPLPWRGWQYRDHGWDDQRWHQQSSGQDSRASSTGMWSQSGSELLPDFVQGWFLLQDAGLETSEKNMVLAALKNDFSVHRVAQELRNQWGDEDLRRRDQGQRASAWHVNEEYHHDDEDDSGYWASPNYDQLVETGLNEEGLALMESTEDLAQEAMVAIEKNKRTLREAREKQKFVKMSRQYYRSSNKSFKKEKTDGTVICFRCGGPHKVANCPQKFKDQASVAEPAHEAPFVCYADATDEHACVASAHITTAQAVSQGKAVLDGGATKTLASVAALEKIMELNGQKKGSHGVTGLDLTDRPMFGFGNSTQDRCLSTASLNIAAGGRQGELRVHTLDRGEGPLLFSIEALRNLGALIDFENDLAVFRHLDAQQVIKLERSSTGHQLLPLTEDLFGQAEKASAPIPSLAAYL